MSELEHFVKLAEVLDALERCYHPQNPSPLHPADLVRERFPSMPEEAPAAAPPGVSDMMQLVHRRDVYTPANTAPYPHVPIGVDAAAVAEISEPGDLWVRSNDLRWERMQHSDGRGGIPRQPGDRPSTWSRRLVGPFTKEQR
jgi:hypothetical protein